VKSTVEDGLRILREASEQAAQIRIELTDDYRGLIAQVEAMPQNQGGVDKTERVNGSRRYLESFRNVTLLPRR
jgi:hypothetical protein